MSHRVKVTIEIDGEKPIVILSTSEKKVVITGFHFEPPMPVVENVLHTNHQVSVVGELFGSVEEFLQNRTSEGKQPT